MGRRITLLVTVVGLGVALAGCPPPTGDPTGGGGGTPADPAADPIVYVAGYRDDGTQNVATYWVDDGSTVTYTELQPGVEGEATDIVVDASGVVHAVGWYIDGSGNKVAAYWRDGTSQVLQSGGQATGLVVDSNGVAYVSGYYGAGPQTAVYWVVSGAGVTPHELPVPDTQDATATGITRDDGAVYVSGYYDASPDTAVYWTDGGGAIATEALYTTNLSQANGLIRVDGVTYVAGRYLDATVIAASWENDSTARTDLPVGSGSGGNARAIARGATATYVAGDYLDGVRRAAYWTGTQRTELESTSVTYPTFAYAIECDDSAILVAGTHEPDPADPQSVTEAVYWHDARLVALSSGTASGARAITARR